MRTALWWIRRDLRLADNQALAAALSHADQIIPVFVLDPALLASPYVGDKRLAFLLGGLRQLDQDLRARGSRLVLRRGEPREVLSALLTQSRADAIFAEEDFSPYARRRDGQVAQALPLQRTLGLTVSAPGAVLKNDGTPYVVFTPFGRKWKARLTLPTDAVLRPPARIPTPEGVEGQPIPTDPALPPGVPFVPGEAQAQRRLEAFVDGEDPPLYRYAETRDRLDLAGTSGLSPYLRFGMLSARQAVVTALSAIEGAGDEAARQSAETWLNELIWREFYVHILYHFPGVRGQSFREKYRNLAWQNDEAAFAAWCEGRTGYPVVDAAMRQLLQTGWMHNRARMIVASFLTKDLLIDWRWGERWFMQHLVDGDPAANNGGWQWAAGTGTDAAPYFRIFNPTLQGKKFDPDGTHVRRWLPALRDVPPKYVHEPWRVPLSIEAPIEAQRACGSPVDQDYPAPIVDHAQMRRRAMALYKKASDEAVTP